ncbi:hypothetical protein GBAR_LOCUS24618 [Geodia barretti]|nr:hypothetical protein GBAR_LOCUS24618 [Geodia barretti]
MSYKEWKKQELLDDGDFHTALEQVAQEPVPYFTQFATQQSATAAHQTRAKPDTPQQTTLQTAQLAAPTARPREAAETATAQETVAEPTTAELRGREGIQEHVEGRRGGGSSTTERSEREEEGREESDSCDERGRRHEEGQIVVEEEKRKSLTSEENRREETSGNLPERGHPDDEVEVVMESILETALLEVMREAEAGLVDITAPHFLVATPTTLTHM